MLERHRLALEAGADPTIVAGWMADTRAQRLAAQRVLASTTVAPTMTAADVRHLIDGLGDRVAVLDEAEPSVKAEVYAALGVQLVLDPERKRVAVTATHPCSTERVGGGT